MTETATRQIETDFDYKLRRMSRLQLEDKAGRLVPFRPNPIQSGLFSVMETQLRAVGYVRVLVLKHRRPGVSTAVDTLFYDDTETFPHRIALVAAHTAPATEVLWKRVRAFRDYTPEAQRRPVTFESVRELQYNPPHGSLFMVRTAGGRGVGRGSGVHDLHISEAAWLENGRATFQGVISCVPDSIPDKIGTMVVVESTANGFDDLFQPMYSAAAERWERGEIDWAGWVPFFVGWLQDASCAEQVPAGYAWGLSTEAERDLKDAGATPEQLYWRRLKLVDFGGDEDIFKQEYPATWREAFLHSGRVFFPASALDRLDRIAREGEPYVIRWDVETESGITAAPFSQGFGADTWSVWGVPDKEHDYVVFGDVALGILADPDDPRSDPDYHAGVVLDRVTLEIVAGMRNRMDVGAFGEELIKAAIWYGMAWVAPEMWPGPGIAALERMRTHKYTHRGGVDGVMREVSSVYNNIYRRERPADRLEVAEMETLGWVTDTLTRPIMMRDLREMMCQEHNPLQVYWQDALAEMRNFIIPKSGKPQAKRGSHDDTVMAIAGAIQLHRRCIRQIISESDTAESTFWATDGLHIGGTNRDLWLPWFPNGRRTGNLTG